jgi:hypothetical protein
VGSTGINNSCGLNNIIRHNKIQKATLFAFKGGYGGMSAVLNQQPRSTMQFCVTKPLTPRFFEGVSFFIMQPHPAPRGTIKTVTDQGSYLTITTSKPMDQVPAIGAEIQILETGTLYDGNEVILSGDNAFDHNGWNGLKFIGNEILFAGEKVDLGAVVSVNAGIWCGYDPQGNYSDFQCDDLIIRGNRIRHTAGSAISIMSTINNVLIESNECIDYSELRENSPNPTIGGIDLCRLSFKRSSHQVVRGNLCRSSLGYGAIIGFSAKVRVENNLISARTGIKINSSIDVVCQDNTISSNGTATETYGILISDDSAGNACSGVLIDSNIVSNTGGVGVKVSDVNATTLEIRDTNRVSAPIAFDINNASDTASYAAQFLYSGGARGQALRFTSRVAASPGFANRKPLGKFTADPGTGGSLRVFGTAWGNGIGRETFQVVFHGDTGSNAVVFTRIAGSTFLEAMDFFIEINGFELVCKYVNNENTTVYMTLEVLSLSRF